MRVDLKNEKVFSFLNKVKAPYKHINKWFCGWLTVVILLLLFAMCIYCMLKYTYGKLDVWDLSARTVYKTGVETIDDKKYLEDKNVITNSDEKTVPSLELDGKTLHLDSKGVENVHITWVYTGNERFEYDGNFQWNDLLEVGKSFNYNTGEGYRRAYDTTDVTLAEEGWYTVFAIWYNNEQKLYVAKNVHIGSVATSGMGTEHEKNAYDTWSKNKRKVRKVPGVKSILFIGADHWDRYDIEESYSDYMVLATINQNNKEVSFTTISKESYVYIPSIGCARLTNAYNCGGVELAVKTIEENYGVDIDNYLLLDYNYYIQMINTVGGIDVDIDKYQIPYINQYIDSLENDYRLTSDIVKTEHLEERSGVFHLDGAQALAYIRYYHEGDWARSERYDAMMEGFYKNLGEIGCLQIANEIFPLFTTNFSFDEYKEFLYYLPLYLKYDVKVNTLPCINRVADFKEGYRYSVLLNEASEIDTVTDDLLLDKDIERRWQWWISPALMIVYAFLFAMSVFGLLYVLLHKRRVRYTDPMTDEVKYKSKKYRYNSEVHVYHQNVLDEYDGNLYMDKEMTQRFSHKIKMPMHELVVYVSMNPVIEDNDNFQNEENKALMN